MCATYCTLLAGKALFSSLALLLTMAEGTWRSSRDERPSNSRLAISPDGCESFLRRRN